MVGRENIDRSVFVGADMNSRPAAANAVSVDRDGTVRQARDPPSVECRPVGRRQRLTQSTHARQVAVGLR